MGNIYLLRLLKKYGLSAFKIYRKLLNPTSNIISVNKYPEVFHFRKGTKDKDIFRHIILDEEYNFKLDFDPKVIIDAGAYTGFSSIYFSTKYKNAKVISIEADGSNYEILLKNISSSYKNIVPINRALWHRSGKLGIHNKNIDHCSVTVGEEEGDYWIDAISLSDVIRDYELSVIDILKMDIEGAEKEIFEHNSDLWLGLVKVLIIEIHDYKKKGCFESVSKALNRLNFEFVKTQNEYIIFRNQIIL